MHSKHGDVNMLKLSYILRMVSLAILSGGCIGVTISAIALVTAAKAHGVTAAVAATANAPMFITFSTVLLGCGIVLMIGEGIDLAFNKQKTKLTYPRYIVSAICVIAALVLSFGVIPPMKAMLTEIHATEQTEQTWKTFHESARIIFGIIIMSALTSLVIPGFEKKDS